MNLARLVGLKGVHPKENHRALLCSKILEWPMLVATLWILSLWYLSTKDSQYQLSLMHDATLWGLFIVESVLLSILVDDTRRYLRDNWMNMLIILAGLPLVIPSLWDSSMTLFAMRLLRILTLFSLLGHVSSSVRKLLLQNSLGPTLFGAAIVIVMAGFMIAAIDPGIKTVADGIWWAWVTVTTVGYGDVVPTSNLGRFFAGILILVGLGLFAMITATFTTLFITETEKEERKRLSKALSRIEHLESKIESLHSKLDHILNKNKLG